MYFALFYFFFLLFLICCILYFSISIIGVLAYVGMCFQINCGKIEQFPMQLVLYMVCMYQYTTVYLTLYSLFERT